MASKAGAVKGTVDIIRQGPLGVVKFFVGVLSKGDGNFFIQLYNREIDSGKCMECSKFWAYQLSK